MSDFRTILKTIPSATGIGLSDSLITIGSCFADNLGQLLQKHKFNVLVSPFGTVYNPLSLHKLLEYAIDCQVPGEDTYGELNETYFNYDFHSSFSALDRPSLKANITKVISNSHNTIQSASVLLVTYGTSWIYERKDNHHAVSNCHKMPSGYFDKKLLTQKRILESFDTLYKKLMVLNPKLRIILTLSPVRHLKDTLELNAVSKSVLRVSCHTMSEIYQQVEYFPAYEIVLDDLRDYRFYDRDLLHPSPEAIDYIWKMFSDRYFDQPTAKFVKDWGEITKALEHRPYHPGTQAHQQFLSGILSKLNELKKSINVDKEINQVRQQMKT